MILNVKDSEILSPACTSRPCIWPKICHSDTLELKQRSSHQESCKTDTKLLRKQLLVSLPLIATFPVRSLTHTHHFPGCKEHRKRVSCQVWETFLLTKSGYSDPVVSDCSPGSLHTNQQQEITPNSIRFPLSLYQQKWLHSFYKASLFSLHRLPEGLPQSSTHF